MDEKRLKKLVNYFKDIDNYLKERYQVQNIDSLKHKYEHFLGTYAYKKMLRKNFEEASAEQSAKEIWKFGRFYDLTLFELVDYDHFTKEDAEDLIENHKELFRCCFEQKKDYKRTRGEIWVATKIGDPFEV